MLWLAGELIVACRAWFPYEHTPHKTHYRAAGQWQPPSVPKNKQSFKITRAELRNFLCNSNVITLYEWHDLLYGARITSTMAQSGTLPPAGPRSSNGVVHHTYRKKVSCALHLFRLFSLFSQACFNSPVRCWKSESLKLTYGNVEFEKRFRWYYPQTAASWAWR